MSSINSYSDLAIFSGKPAFEDKLYVGRPNIGDREYFITCVNDILDRRWVTNNGQYVQEFERRLEALLGVRHCIAVCNATIGLEIAIRALGMSGEVIVPSFTFIATAHALQWQQISPVFCDIDPTTHCIDPNRIEELISPATTGIIGVHTWGRPCDIDALTAIAKRRGLKLLFDAAHAFGCSYNGTMTGNFGDAEVFSFHGTKFFNTFEGGAITTNNDDLARDIRLMKNYGFQGYDNVVSIGINGKMSEISAAMGLSSLGSIGNFIETNRRNYLTYKKYLAGIPGVSIMSYDDVEKTNFQYIVIEIDETQARIDRDSLLDILHAENVIARRYFYPGCHEMEPYKTLYPNAKLRLKETCALVRRVLSLPTGMSVGEDEIAVISEILRFSIQNGRELMNEIEAQKKDFIQ